MDNKVKDKLEELIEQGKNVRNNNYIEVTEPGLIMPNYIAGEEYDLWMNDVKIFTSKYCKEHILYDDIMNAYKTRNNSWGTEAYDNVMSYLSSLINDDDFMEEYSIGKVSAKAAGIGIPEKMIFISHSSLDLDYVKVIVELLEDIGLRGKSSIFCSSVSGYGIPMGRHIYDYLKEQLDRELHVIYLLSENYYNSPACLNEMGAAWIKSQRHTAILTPEFNYNQIDGAIDASRIWFKMNDKEKINEFKNQLIGEFKLHDIEEPYWERKRGEYIKEVYKIYESNKYKTLPQSIELEGIEEGYGDGDFKCIFRFKNKGDSPIKCTFIQLIVEDKIGGKIEITLDNRQLNNLIIFNGENKRIERDVAEINVKIITDFNPYLWNKYEIVESGWSNVL